MKKLIKWLIVIVVVLLLSGGFYVFGKYVVFPSYLSVKYACTNISVEELQEEFGYTLVGTFDPETYGIVLYEPDPMVLKHEKIHYFQELADRLDTCDNQIGLFFDEVEAYTGQYLPDKIFNSIYS